MSSTAGVVHIILSGHTACTDRLAHHLPSGETGVSLRFRERATCPGCLAWYEQIRRDR